VRSNADGLAYLTRLTPRQYADIALDTSTLEDPQWLPAVKGLRILPRPGKVQTIDFPVVMTGEVDGTVYLQEGGKTRGIGNALVELVDDQGRVAASGLSASDGYYIIPAVRPGHYRARISPEQLEKLGLASTAPVELTMRADGEFVYGLDFRLQSKLVADAAGPVKAVRDEEFVVESLTSCRRGFDCNALQANIRRFGYEPTLIPVTTMHLQRLRLGPFAGKKIKQALALARTITDRSSVITVALAATASILTMISSKLTNCRVAMISLSSIISWLPVIPGKIFNTLLPINPSEPITPMASFFINS
jgi:hypothetical protein